MYTDIKTKKKKKTTYIIIKPIYRSFHSESKTEFDNLNYFRRYGNGYTNSGTAQFGFFFNSACNILTTRHLFCRTWFTMCWSSNVYRNVFRQLSSFRTITLFSDAALFWWIMDNTDKNFFDRFLNVLNSRTRTKSIIMNRFAIATIFDTVPLVLLVLRCAVNSSIIRDKIEPFLITHWAR